MRFQKNGKSLTDLPLPFHPSCPSPAKKGFCTREKGIEAPLNQPFPLLSTLPPIYTTAGFPYTTEGGHKKYPPFSSSPLFRNLYSPQKVTFAAGGGKRGKLYVKGQDSTDRFVFLAVFRYFFGFSGFVREKVFFLGGGGIFWIPDWHPWHFLKGDPDTRR